MMLQQTQAERVVSKYELFVSRFPDFETLATASFADILALWQGLGYNRRAIYLHHSAMTIVREYGGKLPPDPVVLQSLPGIGHATAREISAFAFGLPVVFIETNMRRVFIQCFFHNRENVTDREILVLVDETLDREDPRSWYYALMDFGVMLKGKGSNANIRSAHYQKQSRFEGSNRQLRGNILREMTGTSGRNAGEIAQLLNAPETAVAKNLEQLCKEGFLKYEKGKFRVR